MRKGFLRLRCWQVTVFLLACFGLVGAGVTGAGAQSAWPGDTPLVEGGDAAYLPDFSYAGFGFGVVQLPRDVPGTVLDVRDFGAVGDDDIDDSAAVLAALDAANAIAGPVIVQFPAGEFIITEILPIERGDLVLRGAGQGQIQGQIQGQGQGQVQGGTTLFFPRPLAMVDDGGKFEEIREYLVKHNKYQREPARNIDMLFTPYSWTGGFIWVQKPGTRAASYLEDRDSPAEKLTDIVAGERGRQTVLVADTSRLLVGHAVQIQWYNREGEDGPLLQEIYGDTDLDIGSHHWTFRDRPLVRQTTRIIAINGDEVTFGDPLLHNIDDRVPAQMSRWDHLQRVGIEDLHLRFPNAPSFGHHLEQGYNGIYFTSVIDGWVRDVRITNADSGVLTYNSASVTIADLRTEGERMAHYAVHVGNVHNVLVRDLVVANPVIHPLTFNTQSTRSVFQRATVLRKPVLDQHAGANHQNLFDEVTFHALAQRDERGPFYPIWDGSGAGYWQPGHGRFNTTWNLRVVIEGGAHRGETVRLDGLAEGPDARLVGIHGNRTFEVDYRPEPVSIGINAPADVPSLYDWQLAQRLRERD